MVYKATYQLGGTPAWGIDIDFWRFLPVKNGNIICNTPTKKGPNARWRPAKPNAPTELLAPGRHPQRGWVLNLVPQKRRKKQAILFILNLFILSTIRTLHLDPLKKGLLKNLWRNGLEDGLLWRSLELETCAHGIKPAGGLFLQAERIITLRAIENGHRNSWICQVIMEFFP